MILIGQFDSPFVRRVGIALTLYDMSFEHRPWSSFGDREKLRAVNPLMRVPTLVLDDGTVLSDSHMMLDYLDRRVGDAKALFPVFEPDRHRALRTATLAMGICEKAVSLFYETRLHEDTSQLWIQRCTDQIKGALAVLEAEKTALPTEFWFGTRIGHADIAVAVMMRFISDVHGAVISDSRILILRAHAAKLESLPVFKAIQQEFIPPT
jgi:glutathione S-transferase